MIFVATVDLISFDTEVFDALSKMEFPQIYPDPESRRLRAKLVRVSFFFLLRLM